MAPDPLFHQKVAVVTGASSGIGRATALALAGLGARLALAARRTPALEELASRVGASGGEALVVTADVSRQDQVQNLVKETLSCRGITNTWYI